MLKKGKEKARISGKRCYFCTRNRGEAHRKDWKNADEKGIKILQDKFAGNKKSPYFCTRNYGEVLKLLKAGLGRKKIKNFFFEKLAGDKKEFYLCAPQDREFIDRLSRHVGVKKEIKISEKKLREKLARFEKEFYFCTRFLRYGNGIEDRMTRS